MSRISLFLRRRKCPISFPLSTISSRWPLPKSAPAKQRKTQRRDKSTCVPYIERGKEGFSDSRKADGPQERVGLRAESSLLCLCAVDVLEQGLRRRIRLRQHEHREPMVDLLLSLLLAYHLASFWCFVAFDETHV